MLLAGGGIKVMDFGVARLDSSTLTVLGTVVGSVRYMSPEQMMGDRVDGRADVFSLAAVAYEMLTGQAPFPGKTVTEVVSRVVRGAHVPLREADARMPEGPEHRLCPCLHSEAGGPPGPGHGVRPRPARRGRPRPRSRGGRRARGRAPVPRRGPPQEATVFMSAESPAARQAVLLLESDPPGDAEVDGRKVGRTPLALELPFGRHELRLSAVGRDPCHAGRRADRGASFPGPRSDPARGGPAGRRGSGSSWPSAPGSCRPGGSREPCPPTPRRPGSSGSKVWSRWSCSDRRPGARPTASASGSRRAPSSTRPCCGPWRAGGSPPPRRAARPSRCACSSATCSGDSGYFLLLYQSTSICA